MSFEIALQLVTRLAAFAAVVALLEMFRLERAFARYQLMPTGLLAAEVRALSPLVGRLIHFASAHYRALLVLGFCQSALALITGKALFLALLVPLYFLLSLRFRGNLGGGADTFLMQVMMGVSFSALSPWVPWANHVGLSYVAVQLTLSYFLAGVAKLTPDWLAASAISRLVASGNYPTDSRVAKLLGALDRGGWLSRGVLLLELSFPLVLFMPRLLALYLPVFMLFHLGNFIFLGLNRFVFAWVSAYPALISLALSSGGLRLPLS